MGNMIGGKHGSIPGTLRSFFNQKRTNKTKKKQA